jgi:hypothetical protein
MRGFSRLAAACLLLAILAGLSSCALNTPYNKYAIVYGVADYEGVADDLIYPYQDAIAMEAMLSAQGYQVLMKTNSAATKANLDIDIGLVALAAKEEDLFVFYFSGHGTYYLTGPEPAGGDNLTEYILLRGSLGDPDLTYSDDELVDAFAPILARKKVVILDSCNSGGFIGNELETDGEPPSLVEGSDGILERAAEAIRLYANFDGDSADIPPWKAIVLSAAGEREFSYESPNKDGVGPEYYHGVFTHFLLKSEREGDLDRDGWVTVTEAFAYAQDMIYRAWNYGYGYPSDVFSPHVSGGPVDYVLFEVPPP